LAYTLTGADAALLSINATTGAVTLTANPDFETKASYAFNVVATDDGTGTLADTQAVTLAINDLNDAPVITSAAVATALDENSNAGQVIYTAAATDEDSDTLAYTLTGADAALLSINATTGAVTLTANPDFETKASYAFNVVATDDGTGTLFDTQAVTLAINGLNEAPTDISLSSSITFENREIDTYMSSLLVFDVDVADTFTYALAVGDGTTDADNGLVRIDGNMLRVNGAIDFETNPTLEVNVQVTDAGGLTYTKALTFEVRNENEAPVNTVVAQTVNEDAILTVAGISVADVDADSNYNDLSITLRAFHGTLVLNQLTGIDFRLGSPNVNGTQALEFSGTKANVNNALSNFSYLPTLDYNGSDTIRLYSSDRDGLLDYDIIEVTVNSVNDAPITVNKTVTTTEDTSYTFTTNDFTLTDVKDSPANTLVNVIITGLPQGTLKFSGMDVILNQSIPVANIGDLVYTPDADYNGNDHIWFKVQDNGGTENGGKDVSTSSNYNLINVTAVNDAPTITTTDTTVSATGGSLTFNAANSNLISVGDIDSEQLTVTLSTFNGTFDITNASGATVTGADTSGADANTDLTMTGTVAQINSALDGMVFKASGSMDGVLFVSVADGGENGVLPVLSMIEIAVGNSDVPQAVNLTTDSLSITSYDSTQPVFIAGVSAAQTDVVVAGSTVISHFDGTDTYSLSLGGFTADLDGTAIQFDDGSLLKTTTALATLKGGAKDDQLIGGASNDVLRGYAGADKLLGKDGSDIIYGGSGADNITGGLGNDLIYAGDSSTGDSASTDVFNYTYGGSEGSDLIVGFDAVAAGGQDTIRLSGDASGTFSKAASGSNTVITFGAGTTKITLIGVNASDVDATDFSFVA
jgi:hypothetical protein